MRIDTSCVLNSISELRDVGCSPLFHRPLETDANAVEQHGVVEDSGLGALEVSRDNNSASSSAIKIKSPSDMLCSILASSSAAITSSPELNKKLSSPPKETVASSSLTAAATRTTATRTTTAAVDKDTSEGQSLLSRSQARRMKLQQCYNEIMIKSSPTPASIKEQHEQYQQQQQQLEARDDDTTGISRGETSSYAMIQSPRVKKLYNFDNIRDDDHDYNTDNDQVEEYTPTSLLRREQRKIDIAEIEQFTNDMRLRIQRYGGSHKVVQEADDDDDDKNETKKKLYLQQLVDEFEEERRVSMMKTGNNLKSIRQSHHSDIIIKKKKTNTNASSAGSSSNDKDTIAAATVATRWKALQTKQQQQQDDDDDYNNDIIMTDKKTHYSEKEVLPDDKLEAWWKERQQSAMQSFSASERFDRWWASSQKGKNKIKEHCGSEGGGGGGGGGATTTTTTTTTATTAFRELEGEPTVEEEDVVARNGRKRITFVAAAPLNENGNATSDMGQATSTLNTRARVRSRQESSNNKEQHVVGGSNKAAVRRRSPQAQQASSSTAASTSAALLSNKDLSSHSHSQSVANNVASGTLKIVLSRIDEAKEQFVKALEDNDVKKQSELAALLARLGEAATAMRKLGQL